MSKEHPHSKQVHVEIIIRDGCNFSTSTLRSLISIKNNNPSMHLEVVDIADSPQDRKTMGGITPSIWVNDKLWFLGSFSVEDFNHRLDYILSDQA